MRKVYWRSSAVEPVLPPILAARLPANTGLLTVVTGPEVTQSASPFSKPPP